MKKLLFAHIIPSIIYRTVLLWCFTIRVRNKNTEGEDYFSKNPGRCILTLWHSRIFYLFYHYRRRTDFHLLISGSRDGSLFAKIAALMGYSLIRGSTFERAVPAARSLIKLLTQNQTVVVVADGSRGPRHKAQPGSIQLASITGVPIIPLTFDAKYRIELNSWDRFIIPFPFTRCTLNFGKPIHVPRHASEEMISVKELQLERELNRITLESN